MPAPIRDHALSSGCQTAAVVTSGGARHEVPRALVRVAEVGEGEIPQAISHVGLVNAALALTEAQARPDAVA